MLAQIEQVLIHKCLFNREGTVLVGVSGGPDSLCLIDVLAQLGYHCIVAHLDHGLRPESVAEVNIVSQLAEQLGFRFVHRMVDVRAIAWEQKLSIEEAARIQRYQFLYTQAHTHGAQAVAVGHTADDQVETVLMHLLRGAGIAGLKGMLYRTLPNFWSKEIPLLRPLLGIWRHQVMEYLQDRKLTPLMDASNLDMNYYRNRLRHEFIPFLEGFNPRVRHNLLQTAEILQEDSLIIEGAVDQAWDACLLSREAECLVFSSSQLRLQPAGVIRHLMRRGIELLLDDVRDLDYAALQRASGFISAPSTNHQIDLLGGLCLSIEQEQVILTRQGGGPPREDWLQLPGDIPFLLNIPGELRLSGAWLLKASVDPSPTRWENGRSTNTDRFIAAIDCQGLDIPLRVRARRPGDRIAPLGMGGHTIKLSDLMVNVKLPRRARSRWPLVCGVRKEDGKEEILWVPGYRQDHRHRVTEDTREIVTLQAFKL